MKRLLPHFLASVLVVGLLGTSSCAVRAGYMGPSVGIEPNLAEVYPGVWAVQGYAEPVFYAENGYWLYRNNVWYRSHTYNGGWVRSYYLPHTIRTRIRNPYRYRRWRASRHMRTRRVYRINRSRYRTRYRHSRYNRRHNRRVIRHNRRGVRHNRRGVRHNRRVNRRNRRVIRRNTRVKRRNTRTRKNIRKRKKRR